MSQYNLMGELKYLMKMLDDEGNKRGAQAVSQAIARLEHISYDLEMYKRAYNARRELR